jgi:hypothetical protein
VLNQNNNIYKSQDIYALYAEGQYIITLIANNFSLVVSGCNNKAPATTGQASTILLSVELPACDDLNPSKEAIEQATTKALEEHYKENPNANVWGNPDDWKRQMELTEQKLGCSFSNSNNTEV